jgi:hypothetical protein
MSLTDPHPRMDDLQNQLLEQVSATEKLVMLAQFNETGRLLALTGVRSRFPLESEPELQLRLAALGRRISL